jgi:hypothetical protein
MPCAAAHALLDREERSLLVVVRDADDHLVEQFARALDDIEVAVRDRIEAAGINSAAHRREIRRGTAGCKAASDLPNSDPSGK